MKGTTCLIAAAIGLAMLAGCTGEPEPGITPLVPTPSGSSATPSPTPTPSATPTPSSTELTKQELFQEAEKTYRAYVVEQLKLEAMGGSDNLTPGMDKYLMEPYREAVRQAYVKFKAGGSKLTRTDKVTLSKIALIDESIRPGAVVALTICMDSSQAVIVQSDGKKVPGVKVVRNLYFTRDADAKLKIFSGNAEQVETC